MWRLPSGGFMVAGQAAPALRQLGEEQGATLLGSSAVYVYYSAKVGGRMAGAYVCLPACLAGLVLE
jgi:hypothetical protein